MMDLYQAIAYYQCCIAEHRRLLRILETAKASDAFHSLKHTDPHRAKFEEVIMSKDPDRIRDWFDKARDPNLGALSLVKLRELARGYQVPYYYRMNKLELIQAINHRQELERQRNEQRENQGTTCGDGTVNA